MSTDISNLVYSAVPEEVESGLVLAAEVFERRRSTKDQPGTGEEDLKTIRDCLCSFVGSSTDSNLTATAVWALGKLHDHSLTPFFTRVLKSSVPHDNASIYQSLVALSNVGVVRFPSGSGSMFDIEENRIVAKKYLDEIYSP